MPSTSIYGFRYPSLADPPNVPAAVQDLANDIETELNRHGVVGRNQRTTSLGVPAGSAGALARVISTSAPVRPGRTYRVSAHAEVYTDGAPATVQAELRYTTDGTEPTTTSALVNRWLGRADVDDIPVTVSPSGLYTPSSGGTLRAVLCTLALMSGGTGYQVGGLAGYPCEIVIEDVGPARAVSGAVYSA